MTELKKCAKCGTPDPRLTMKPPVAVAHDQKRFTRWYYRCGRERQVRYGTSNQLSTVICGRKSSPAKTEEQAADLWNAENERRIKNTAWTDPCIESEALPC